jgi:hypothetical protein
MSKCPISFRTTPAAGFAARLHWPPASAPLAPLASNTALPLPTPVVCHFIPPRPLP